MYHFIWFIDNDGYDVAYDEDYDDDGDAYDDDDYDAFKTRCSSPNSSTRSTRLQWWAAST